jgi:hypothetical protein
MTNGCNLGVTYKGKKPYLYVIDDGELVIIAQLKIKEDEFWWRLERALKMKLAGAGGCLDMTEHIEKYGVKR